MCTLVQSSECPLQDIPFASAKSRYTVCLRQIKVYHLPPFAGICARPDSPKMTDWWHHAEAQELKQSIGLIVIESGRIRELAYMEAILYSSSFPLSASSSHLQSATSSGAFWSCFLLDCKLSPPCWYIVLAGPCMARLQCIFSAALSHGNALFCCLFFSSLDLLLRFSWNFQRTAAPRRGRQGPGRARCDLSPVDRIRYTNLLYRLSKGSTGE